MRGRRFVALATLLAAAACATARPDFEQSFTEHTQSRQAWWRLLVTRYGCNIDAVRMAARSSAQAFAPGAEVCLAAAFVAPERVRSWQTSRGIREEWEYVAAAVGSRYGRQGPAGRCTLSFEGPREQALRVVNVVC